MSVKRSAAATAPSTGVPEALGALFDREYEPMYRLAFTMLGTDRDAEEVVQDAFVGVASRWESLDNPGGYLRVSVVNGARKRMRTQIRRTTAEAELRASTPEASWDSGDYLLDLVDGLPDRQRVVVILIYYSGLNSTEVGELLDCPPGTVRSLAHRALTQLREQVTP